MCVVETRVVQKFSTNTKGTPAESNSDLTSGVDSWKLLTGSVGEIFVVGEGEPSPWDINPSRHFDAPNSRTRVRRAPDRQETDPRTGPRVLVSNSGWVSLESQKFFSLLYVGSFLLSFVSLVFLPSVPSPLTVV